ncbi:MAG: 5-formyltetrahydrofolate cyclo-ligase [Victivallaceae bacterium]|nr:5-formyltetrahydrofolate cyclo-ligase [Victivallaceae bacterium]
MIPSTKDVLRKEFLKKRADMGLLSRARANRAILTRATMLLTQFRAAALALYASDGTEPDLLPLLSATGLPVSFPRYNPASGQYEWVPVHCEDELRPGRYGINEPDRSIAAQELPDRTFYFVPLLAFDRTGTRLGRGKGFYDRLLAAAPENHFFAGMAYALQEATQLPSEAHDIKLDAIVTDLETIRINMK